MRREVERFPGYAREFAVAEVALEDGSLRPLVHHVRHSPTGFEWGYGGSGPADLALAIAWDVLRREPTAPECSEVLWKLVANLPEQGGTISEDQVRAALGLAPSAPPLRWCERCGEWLAEVHEHLPREDRIK